MNAIAVIQTSMTSTHYVLNSYLGDLSDADLLVRPVPNANHIAWQLGHLIVSERKLVKEQLPDASYPDLPSGFAEAHSAGTPGKDEGFFPKAVYLEQLRLTQEATLATIRKLSEADLDRPTTGQMASFAPTLGAHLLLVANHTMMHGGQFSVIRRKLGKPVLF